LESGADPEVRDNNKETPLELAVKLDAVEILKVFHDKGVNFNVKGEKGETLLHTASLNGSMGSIQFLIDVAGLDVNSRDDFGRTPLIMTTKEDRIDVAKLLIEKGAQKIKDNYGKNPLHFCSIYNAKNVASLLVELGEDVNEKDFVGKTPLHYAAVSNSSDVAEILLKAGANPLEKDKTGRTPLDEAVNSKKFKVLKVIVNYLPDNIESD
jgi:ankyrin repeat protein